MKHSVLTFLFCALGAMTMQGAVAADAPPSKAKPTAVKRSMGEKGTFHTVHARKAKTECDDCHSEGPLADNVLLASRHRPLGKGSPGPVDPKECYDCHRLKSNPPVLYAPR